MKTDDASAPIDRSLFRLDVCHGCRMTFDLDLICELRQGRVSRMALPHQRRSPVLPLPMHDSHSGYTAWGEGWGAGQFGVQRSSHDTRYAEVPSPRPSPPRGAREKGPSPRPSPPRGAREKGPSPRPSPHAEHPQANCSVGRGRARSSTRVRCRAWRPLPFTRAAISEAAVKHGEMGIGSWDMLHAVVTLSQPSIGVRV
jgi:hypothetical protein